ncbi:MAG: HDOD domain-containing protein [Pirellulaceae bacterium]|nr:HDOD domain-containing protein [Pirellulaceae bacterium]
MIDPTATGLIQQFVERTGQLYSLPAVAADVLRLTSEPQVDARLLKDCLERDPALTTRILKVVNSSLFGLARPVTDLGQALALLGTRPLKMLVLGFSLPRDLFAGLEASVLSRYWQHTLVKATASRELAVRCWQIQGDEAFTAGLLQDLGVLALCQQLGDSYQKLLDHVQTHGGSLLDRELDVLGFDHGILSARLLMHWQLPPHLCAAVASSPDETRIAKLDDCERTLPQILHLAELLARFVEQPHGPALAELLDVGGRYCGLTLPRLQPIAEVLQSTVRDLAEVLDLQLPAEANYVQLLLESQTRLAELTVNAVAEPEPEHNLLELTGDLQREIAAVSSGRKTTTARRQPISLMPPASAGRAPTAAPVIASHPCAATLAFGAATRIAADPGLLGRLTTAIARCRQARAPLSLALVEIDRQQELVHVASSATIADLLHELRIALSQWTGERLAAYQIGDATFALIGEGCPRSDALQAVRGALRQVKTWQPPGDELAETKLSLSAGIATLAFPPRNFPAEQLLDAAQRCLSGAALSGGDTLKSIEF